MSRRQHTKDDQAAGDVERALGALDAEQLRELARVILSGVDADVRARIEDFIVKHASAKSAFRPAAPDAALVDEVKRFVSLGRRVGEADPETVDHFLRSATKASLAGDYPTARAVFDALASLAATLRPEPPPTALRGRLMATLASKAKLKRSALLVIDMIKDHLEPGRPLEVPRARDVVPALSKRLDEARAAGVPIVYIVDEHDADDPDLDEWGGHAVKGTDGTEVWPPIAPKPGDRIVNKGAYSAFFETKLASVLDELGVDSLVLTGCMTEIGIMSTATDAMQRGFEVTVPVDSQAGGTAISEQSTLGALGLMAPYGPARKKLLASLEARAF